METAVASPGMATTAAIVYAVVAAYLAARGVEPRRIAKILAMGLLAGIIGAYTLGLAFFLVVLFRPVETIAAFSIAMLFVSASMYAREEILGTITPAGIVVLNVAANMVSGDGPLPLSFAGIAASIPVPYGPLRVVLNLLVLYWPSLLALWMLWRGPPGAPVARHVLGAWVCWVGIAAIAGPGWNAVANFRIDEPARLIASGFAAYASVHAVMLVLNLLLSVGGTGDEARSLARSVRVDTLKASHALAAGLAFWAAAWLFRRLPLAYDVGDAVLLAAAFALGSLLARGREPEPEAAEDSLRRSGSLPWAGIALLYVVVFGGFAFWAWVDTPAARASRIRVDPLSGTQLKVRPVPGALVGYPEADLHALLKERLTEAGVSFAASTIKGREYLRVPDEHREAMKRVIASIEGPDLPGGRAMRFEEHQPRHRQFRDWLAKKGVKWEMVRKRRETYIVWEDGPRHDRLYRAFDEGARRPWLGVDFHALLVLAPGAGNPPMDPDRTAAFETAEHREPFLAWLRQRGVDARTVSRAGREFVVWEAPQGDLLQRYIGDMFGRCTKEYHEVAAKAAPAIVPNPC